VPDLVQLSKLMTTVPAAVFTSAGVLVGRQGKTCINSLLLEQSACRRGCRGVSISRRLVGLPFSLGDRFPGLG
jgi:hypothetical protein